MKIIDGIKFVGRSDSIEYWQYGIVNTFDFGYMNEGKAGVWYCFNGSYNAPEQITDENFVFMLNSIRNDYFKYRVK